MTIAPSLKAFLDTIAVSQGTSREDITQNDGYDVIVTGEVEGSNGCLMRHEEIFTDYSDHPFASGRPAVLVREGPPPLYSTASGRYQLEFRWWPAYKTMLHLPDFTPQSQDAVAIEQMKERGAVALIAAGDIQGAITACASIWASFPGNDYGQGGNTMGALLEQYQTFVNG